MNSLPTIELNSRNIDDEKAREKIKELNKNRGPQKENQASCSEYYKHFAKFGLKGTCRDCPSDDLAGCYKTQPGKGFRGMR